MILYSCKSIEYYLLNVVEDESVVVEDLTSSTLSSPYVSPNKRKETKSYQ